MDLINIKEENGKQLVSARELYSKLEITERFNSWFGRMKQYGLVEGVDYTRCKQFNTLAKQELDEYILTLGAAKSVCVKSKSINVGEIINQLGGDVTHIHTNTRFEISFLEMLEQGLEELNVTGIRQYNVNGKRIDFYIPEYKLAVEYDEAQHYTAANQKLDLERQKMIEKEIGCTFVRLNWEDTDIKNTMKVVKKILKLKGEM